MLLKPGMTEQEAFKLFDEEIQTFKDNEGLYKGIKINNRPHSDWLIFHWRQLCWTENEFEHILEIYPEFNQQEQITGWTVYAAGWFDQDLKRHYLKKILVQNVSLESIVGHLYDLLKAGNAFLQSLRKEDIH